MQPITAIIVNYNTPEIITRAVESIKNHVPFITIVDGSDKANPAYSECDLLSLNYSSSFFSEPSIIKVIHTHVNIGHGPGLNIGIQKAKTPYIIVMDSDAVLREPSVISEMYNSIQGDNVYGAGLVVNVTDAGTTDPKGKYKYLHPYFAMFKKDTFNKYAPFINHGAPWLRTMKEINGKMDVVNIDNIQKKVWHEHRRTRLIAGKDWQTNWEKAW